MLSANFCRLGNHRLPPFGKFDLLGLLILLMLLLGQLTIWLAPDNEYSIDAARRTASHARSSV